MVNIPKHLKQGIEQSRLNFMGVINRNLNEIEVISVKFSFDPDSTRLKPSGAA
jgi:hypothetical protein